MNPKCKEGDFLYFYVSDGLLSGVVLDSYYMTSNGETIIIYVVSLPTDTTSVREKDILTKEFCDMINAL